MADLWRDFWIWDRNGSTSGPSPWQIYDDDDDDDDGDDRQWTLCILTAERQSEVTSTHKRVIHDDRLWKPERVPQSANFVRAGLTKLATLSLTLRHVSALNQESNSCVLLRPWLHRQLCLTAAVQIVLSARKVNMTVNTEHTSNTSADAPPNSVHSASKPLVMLWYVDLDI